MIGYKDMEHIVYINMRIEKFTSLKNTDRLSKIIFLNFIELQNQVGISFSINEIARLLTSSKLIGWFLLDDSKNIIGYIVGETRTLNDGRYVYYINYFYIVPKYRSKGIGKDMLMKCIDEIAMQNIKFIMLMANVDSSAFKLYSDLGFVIDPSININNDKYKIMYMYCNGW
jgi:ribosomal protein S18 acetylase RimI-like enzyme